MGLLSDFYLSTPDNAAAYDENRDAFAGTRHQHERITDVELSILWSILRDEEWDSDLLDEFEMLFEANNGERLIIQLPQAFLDLVIQMTPQDAAQAAEMWSETEELQCDPEEVQPVIDGLLDLAKRSKESGEGVYLWISV